MDDTIRSLDPASGRFVLRISPGLHAQLRRAAVDAGLSLNRYCEKKLASPGGVIADALEEVVARAANQFGDALVGILAFGSWARGTMTEQSDVDILVVVDEAVPIVRSLYAVWDERPLVWEGSPIQVHVVHAPDVQDGLTGLWAEAALEGIVLIERGFELSRRLVGLRRRIAEGAISRRETHGQPYWVSEG